MAIFTANTEKGLEILNNNILINMGNSTLEELKKSQPLGYPLKFNDRKITNKKIKFLKYLYRFLPKNPLFKKILYKLRSIILIQISEGNK